MQNEQIIICHCTFCLWNKKGQTDAKFLCVEKKEQQYSHQQQ